MEGNLEIICNTCHFANPPGAYFCSNCGKSLKDKPLSSTVGKQAVIYFVSFFLPPLGLWYVWKYLKQPDSKSKKIGITAFVLTFISIIIAIWYSVELISIINQSMSAFNSL